MKDLELKNYMAAQRAAYFQRAAHYEFEAQRGDFSNGFAQWATVDAFSEFAKAVYDKAMQAREKYGYTELGWATPDWELDLQRSLAEHVQKGDPRDVAVLAMFAWFHGWSTALPLSGDIDEQLHAILGAIPTEFPSLLESGEYYQDAGVKTAIRTLLQTNTRLVDETRRWSEAVKKLEAERTNPSLANSPLVGISGAAYSWLDAKNNPPTEFDPEDEFFTRKFIVCIDGKVSTDAAYFTRSGRWIIAGRHGDAVNVTHYRDYPADPA